MNQTALSTPVALGPELTIAHAAEQRERLLRALANADADADLQLDLAGVSDCDSSGVQLLLATQQSLQARGQALALLRPSVAVQQALATFGLAGRWADPCR